jgi:hypothetical protein
VLPKISYLRAANLHDCLKNDKPRFATRRLSAFFSHSLSRPSLRAKQKHLVSARESHHPEKKSHMGDSRLRSYLNDSKPVDLKKNEGMRVLMAIKGNLDQTKNPSATRFAAAEMAIEKVNKYHCCALHVAQLLLNWALIRFALALC